jgi:hypothetical protein
LEIKHLKWIWENNAWFPDSNDNAFQTTLDSINASTSIAIDYINKETNLKTNN